MAVDSALLMLLAKEESASLRCVFVILNYIFFPHHLISFQKFFFLTRTFDYYYRVTRLTINAKTYPSSFLMVIM